jgi:hypothetical protein
LLSSVGAEEPQPLIAVVKASAHDTRRRERQLRPFTRIIISSSLVRTTPVEARKKLARLWNRLQERITGIWEQRFTQTEEVSKE